MKYNKGFPPWAQRIRQYVHDHVLLYLSRPSSEKKPLARQLSEMARLFRRYRHVPHHYLTHELYRLDLDVDVDCFVPPPLLRRLIDRINPLEATPKVEDKRLFASLMYDANLPHVPVLAFVRKDGVITDAQDREISYASLVNRLRDAGFRTVFAKPTEGANGVGHFKCEVDADVLFVEGRDCALTDLMARMFGDGLFDDYLLQPVVEQHDVLQRLNPASVNTIRIDSFLIDGTVRHDGAVLRIGGGNACIDNWAAGGFLAKIDLETGALAPTARSKAKFGRKLIRAHPVTGVVLDGIRLPYWLQVKELAAAAALAVRPLRYVGWDIALTATGPVLIEGNHPSDVSMLQDGVGGLANTPIGQEAIRNARGGGDGRSSR
jgi:hypothetical protein